MIHIPDTALKRIVIIGGGFGGLAVANKLNKSNYQVVLIDKYNYHQFQPLLYQVASAGLEPGSISFPFRKLLGRHKNFYFRLAEVNSILCNDNVIETSIGKLHYDYLVIAAGTTTNFFGNSIIQKSAVPMKSIEEALLLRNKILCNIEQAIDCNDPEEKQRLLNIAIVGGGATGVEVAGAFAEFKKYIKPKDYPELKDTEMNIFLIEGTDKLLRVMSENSSAYSLKFLQEMGVTVILNKLVENYENGNVILNDGEKIPAETLIWVSGVICNQFENIPKEAVTRGARLISDEYNRLQGYKNVFVIGDICLQTEEQYPNGHPQVAPVAIQQGKNVAENFKRMLKNKPLKPFHYKDKGTLATVGRNKAVADIKGIKLSGFPAWAVWMLVHLRSILGVRNKIEVLIDWVWSYFTYDKSKRFILFKNNQN